MKLSVIVDALRADLDGLAGLGDGPTAAAAARLSEALQAAVALRLLEALGEAAAELSSQLRTGRVEVRLTGRDPELLYVEEQAPPDGRDETEPSARVTLRLPEGLKGRIEAAAQRDRVSVNTWLVNALSRATSGERPRPGRHLRGYGRS